MAVSQYVNNDMLLEICTHICNTRGMFMIRTVCKFLRDSVSISIGFRGNVDDYLSKVTVALDWKPIDRSISFIRNYRLPLPYLQWVINVVDAVYIRLCKKCSKYPWLMDEHKSPYDVHRVLGLLELSGRFGDVTLTDSKYRSSDALVTVLKK